MQAGLFTLLASVVVLLFLVLLVLGAIYHRVKQLRPWNGVERRCCTEKDDHDC